VWLIFSIASGESWPLFLSYVLTGANGYLIHSGTLNKKKFRCYTIIETTKRSRLRWFVYAKRMENENDYGVQGNLEEYLEWKPEKKNWKQGIRNTLRRKELRELWQNETKI